MLPQRLHAGVLDVVLATRMFEADQTRFSARPLGCLHSMLSMGCRAVAGSFLKRWRYRCNVFDLLRLGGHNRKFCDGCVSHC